MGIMWAILIGMFLLITTTTITVAILRSKEGHFLSMEWKSFVAPDNSCGIDLLGRPVEEGSDPEHGERRYISEGWYSGTTAWIGWRNLTQIQVQGANADKGWVQLRKVLFEPELERLKQKYGGYIAKDATTNFQNPITVEVRLETPQGPLIERMVVIPNSAHPRVYFFGMTGKGLDLDGPEVKRLFDSFRTYD